MHLKSKYPQRTTQRNQSTTLWAIAHIGNQGRGEEEVYHTFGLPLFIWYLVANEENEAQKKRKQNPAKVNTLAFKNTNGDVREEEKS